MHSPYNWYAFALNTQSGQKQSQTLSRIDRLELLKYMDNYSLYIHVTNFLVDNCVCLLCNDVLVHEVYHFTMLQYMGAMVEKAICHSIMYLDTIFGVHMCYIIGIKLCFSVDLHQCTFTKYDVKVCNSVVW